MSFTSHLPDANVDKKEFRDNIQANINKAIAVRDGNPTGSDLKKLASNQVQILKYIKQISKL
ncbi:MAG: hypothetical protein KAJ03_10885 [Gammaproteobacteria bacterium]|nr:hypothetical protein [Gammaproteobacteria bacterium]